MGILIVVVFILVMIGLGVWSHIQAQRRRRELAAWATRRGLSFNPGTDESFDYRYGAFSCLARGSDRYAYNVMTGTENGRPVRAFDYHYKTHTQTSKGRQTHHHHFSAVIVDAGLPLKPLVIRAETIFDKIGEFLGMDDIDFESSEFSRRFCVKSPDRRWAFDVLHQKAMEFLLQSPSFNLDLGGTSVIAYRGGLFPTGDFEGALSAAQGLLDLLPESVVKELRGRGLSLPEQSAKDDTQSP
jgi:hypothetical protein